MADGDVTLVLTADEALVLSDWLERVYGDASATPHPLVEDRAELVALWSLHAVLERQLVAIFQPDYGEQVRAARKRLRGERESN